MTPVIIGTALALLALDSAPANSTQSTPVAPATVQGSKMVGGIEDPDKVICHNQPLTGSRFNRRVCMTRAEWAHQQEETEVLERRLNQTTTPMGGGGMNK